MMRSLVITLFFAANAFAGDYEFFLPSRYDAAKKWPIVYVFDPGARGVLATEKFRAAAEEYGWIVVTSNVTRNGMNWDDVARAVASESQSVSKQFSIDPKRVYTAGFSGGAMIAWWVAQQSKGVTGVIACGSPRVDTSGTIRFDWFGVTGEVDFNNAEGRAIDESLQASAHRLDVIEGGHDWAPPDEMRRAFAWMELQAMKRGTRARDDAMIAQLLKDDVAFADAPRDELQRMRRYEAIARTYDGLANVDDARAQSNALKFAAAKLAKEEAAADRYERSFDPRIAKALDNFLHADVPQNAAWLANELQIPHLRKVAADKTYRGLAAQRALGRIRAQLSMLSRDLQAKNGTALLAIVRDVLRKAAV